jgi:hypothetical protein
MRPEAFTITDHDLIAFADPFGSPASFLSGTEDEDTNPLLQKSTNVYQTVTEFGVWSVWSDAAIVIDESSFIPHIGGIHTDLKLAI